MIKLYVSVYVHFSIFHKKNIHEVKEMQQKKYTSFGINLIVYNQVNKQSFIINICTSVPTMLPDNQNQSKKKKN